MCPADAIKQTEGGIVQSALKPRCIGCSNCVLACPFGVPKYMAEFDQMMKCDMCTDRTSEGLKPMCASVCPSEALWYGTLEEFAEPAAGRCSATSMFGRQEVRTKVYTVVDDTRVRPHRRPRRARRARGSTIPSISKGRSRDDATRSTVEPVPVAPPPWKRDFPYEAAAEEEVTRREFARYLVARCRGTMAAGNVGHRGMDPAAHASTPASHARSSLSPTSTSAARTCSATRGTTTRRSSFASTDTEVVAFSQKCTHLGCVVYYQADGAPLALPVPRRQLRSHAPAT